MSRIRELLKHAIDSARKLRHAEWIPIAVLLVVALAIWAFVELADEVAEGDLEKFDRAVLLSLREGNDADNPLGPSWLEEAMRDVTALGSVAVLSGVTVAACGFLWLQGKHSAVLYVLVAVVGALVLSSTFKWFYARPRPDLFPHGDKVYTASFPSGHSSMSAAVYLTLGALLARYQEKRKLRVYLVAIAVVLTISVGVSRVYLSVHWPTDVLAGWTLGAAWALACWVVAYWLERRGMIEQQAE
ncbi:phosphatase PAP2 family protein [Aeoliella sp. ICT_H6.2]|uniref:Phosphatase PAP2 family protein n=1 Tax=Aeoliella straminimaris TaxID=2954799 RepID=A0A9X2FG55_9BACT|nr:phosphatase PAP2 family protein [Aeoliella straminimaris]MCO6043606.1 phosphatase PAP2 family protein [Aeoliella straminimaris]